jgi:hypothetical protein
MSRAAERIAVMGVFRHAEAAAFPAQHVDAGKAGIGCFGERRGKHDSHAEKSAGSRFEDASH